MDTFSNLKEECLSCKKCPLWETRTNVVFGVGNENAEVMFIGEGPGKNEDLQGEPFVGAAGKLLDTMLSLIDLDRTKIYIANIVKCRPPQNRDPLPAEQDLCISYLERQIELIDPKIIVCLGRIAAMRLIRADFKITREHGIFFPFEGSREICATLHPAALLRDPNRKVDSFMDLKNLDKKIKEYGI